jgi:hypothetical protein
MARRPRAGSGRFWIDFIPVPQIDAGLIAEFIRPTWQALIDGAIYVHPRLGRSSASQARRGHPDNVSLIPGVMAAAGRDCQIVSLQSGRDQGPIVAPFSSGCAADRPLGDLQASTTGSTLLLEGVRRVLP